MLRAVLAAAADCGGLRPLTFSQPRALIQIAGRTLIDRWLEALAAGGVVETVVRAGRFAQGLSSFVGDGRRWGLRSGFSFEGRMERGEWRSEPLDLAAGLLQVHDRSGFCNQTFVLAHCDSWCDIDLRAMVENHRASGTQATVAVSEGGRCPHGFVQPDAAGSVSSWSATAGPKAAPLTGVLLLEPSVVELLRTAPPPASTGELIWRLLEAQAQVQSFQANAWLPLETLDDYWRMTLAALDGRLPGLEPPGPEVAPGVFAGAFASVHPEARLTGPLWVGPGAVVEEGAKIEGPCWIGANSRIAAGAQVSRSIIDEQTRLGNEARLTDLLVVGNRAVDRDGRIRFLEPHETGWSFENVAPPTDQSAVQTDLLKLATRVARRGVPLFR